MLFCVECVEERDQCRCAMFPRTGTLVVLCIFFVNPPVVFVESHGHPVGPCGID